MKNLKSNLTPSFLSARIKLLETRLRAMRKHIRTSHTKLVTMAYNRDYYEKRRGRKSKNRLITLAQNNIALNNRLKFLTNHNIKRLKGMLNA